MARTKKKNRKERGRPGTGDWGCAKKLIIVQECQGVREFHGKKTKKKNLEGRGSETAHRSDGGGVTDYRERQLLWGLEEGTKEKLQQRNEEVQTERKKKTKPNVQVQPHENLWKGKGHIEKGKNKKRTMGKFLQREPQTLPGREKTGGRGKSH